LENVLEKSEYGIDKLADELANWYWYRFEEPRHFLYENFN